MKLKTTSGDKRGVNTVQSVWECTRGKINICIWVLLSCVQPSCVISDVGRAQKCGEAGWVLPA